MKRLYETNIKIEPTNFNIGYESATDDSDDDIDSIHSGFYESALEQVERDFSEFDTGLIGITAAATWEEGDQRMIFDKELFYYWLDDGIVELSAELTGCSGNWTTIDSDTSAKGKIK